jgi:hypothetical protein
VICGCPSPGNVTGSLCGYASSSLRRAQPRPAAVAARCRMLKLKAASVAPTSTHPGVASPFTYRDDLGFLWEDLSKNRKILCEYCFFGGPDKTVPFDRDDWFEPLPGFVIGHGVSSSVGAS